MLPLANLLRAVICNNNERYSIIRIRHNTVCDNRFHWNEVEKQIPAIPTPDISLANFWTKFETTI